MTSTISLTYQSDLAPDASAACRVAPRCQVSLDVPEYPLRDNQQRFQAHCIFSEKEEGLAGFRHFPLFGYARD